MNRSENRGFTLLEIMLAMFVFALTASVLFGAYRATLRNVTATKESLSGYGTARTALMRMAEDLESVRVTLPPVYKKPDAAFSEPDPLRFVCEPDPATSIPRLRFTSRAHVDFTGTGKTGTAEIVYYAEKDKNGPGYLIRRRDTLDFDLFPKAPRADPVLCDHVKSLSYSFLDEEGEGKDSWDSESATQYYATPVAVAIELVLYSENEEKTAGVFDTMVNVPVYREKMD
ncbi:MAG: prepilin-type N-terminal cleavage/methylation domain-containing protein [Thermodesulfobacteriota bacterium]